MIYIVFSRYRNADGGLESKLYHYGVSKTAAIEKFNDHTAGAFNVNASAGNLYFVGFDSDLSFIEEIDELRKNDEILDSELINSVLRNIKSATCINTLNISGYRPSWVISTNTCEECDCTSASVQKNVYGTYLCSDCWVKYWTTRESLAEYVVGLAHGTYKIDSFSNEDKDVITNAWSLNERDENAEEIPNSSNRVKLKTAKLYSEEELHAIEIASGLYTKTEVEIPELGS